MPDMRLKPPVTIADLMHNYNEPSHGHTHQTFLNGLLVCYRINQSEVLPGDIFHSYSSQLDAFTTYEIIEVNPWTTVEIDSDSFDLRRTPVVAGVQPTNWEGYSFWRVLPKSRELWEHKGWKRVCGGYSFYRRTEYDVFPFVILYPKKRIFSVASTPGVQRKSLWNIFIDLLKSKKGG